MEVTAVDKKKYEQYIQGTIQKYKAAKQDLEIKFRRWGQQQRQQQQQQQQIYGFECAAAPPLH